jgi:hypothetical protein
MCYKDSNRPFIIPLEIGITAQGRQLVTVTLLLGKVTTKRNGEHVSSRGLLYPIHQTIHDTNAKAGDHANALYFAASPESAFALHDNYGSHVLAVIPGPQVWDPLSEKQNPARCWHSDSCTPILCMDCAGLKAEDLNSPDFWRAFQKGCEQGNDFVLRLPRDEVWHR